MNDPVRNPYILPQSLNDSAISAIDDGSLSSVARTGQIITFALIQGLVFVGGILLYLTLTSKGPDTSPLWVPGIGVAAAIAAWITAGFVPPILRRQTALQLRSSNLGIDLPSRDEEKSSAELQQFARAHLTATLVGQALLETGAMINLVLMLIDHRIALHLTFVVAATIGIAFLTPTIDRIRHSAEPLRD